jgi:hypothetical protein
MGVINLRKQYIDKIMSEQQIDNDIAMDEDSNLTFLESLSLAELKVLAEDCE